MSIINEKMSIGEILKSHPETLNVFKSTGFKAETPEELIEQLGESLMLQTALKVKGLNITLFIKMLNEYLADYKNTESLSLEKDIPNKNLDFLGVTYCPLKMTFSECFEEALSKYNNETGKSIVYNVPSGCGTMEATENAYNANSIEDFPNIITAAGFKEFFKSDFVNKFMNKGYFKSIPQKSINNDIPADIFQDPDNEYTIYSVMPLVLLIDKTKLGNLPTPQKWKDILNPIYKNNIITAFKPEDIAEEILLYTYKEFGEVGLELLAGNIKDACHASKMAKMAGSGNKDGAAIYIIPWFFANTCANTENTEIIWPSDGALVTPLFALAKADKLEDLKFVADFITGPYYGQKSADNYFPVLNPEVENNLPLNATFKWLGWDYIKSHPMEKLIEEVSNIFHKYWIYEVDRSESVI